MFACNGSSSISPFKQLGPWKSESLCTCRIRLNLTLFANQWHRICTLQLNLLIYENNETSCNSSLSLVQIVKPCMHDRKAEAKTVISRGCKETELRSSFLALYSTCRSTEKILLAKSDRKFHTNEQEKYTQATYWLQFYYRCTLNDLSS